MSEHRNPMTPIRRRVLILLSGALVLTTVSSASATTVRQFDLEEMVEAAEQIFLGTCLSGRCEAGPSGICTRTTFRIKEPIKGTFGADTLRLRLPVGTIDGTRCTIPGMPSFEPGEEIVLFLTEEDEDGYPWVVGLSQGKFSVIPDPVSRRKIVVNAASGDRRPVDSEDEDFSIAGPTASGVAGIAGMELDAFLARIRSLLEEHGKTIPGDNDVDVQPIEDVK